MNKERVVPDEQQLLAFADDWGRHPLGCQNLIQRLLRRYPVMWVNTIGMRLPRFDLLTLTRGFEKVRRWSRDQSEASLPDNLTVLQPIVWPGFRRRLDLAVNRRLLLRCLDRWLAWQEALVTAITTLPIVADLME